MGHLGADSSQLHHAIKGIRGVACRADYWPYNHAKRLKNPANYQHTEREPFTDEQMDSILKAARTVELDNQQPVSNDELETFILVMRHTGMAIADAALLQKSRW